MHYIKKNIIIFFNAFAALVVYGGWAVYANFEHGRHAWVMAGAVQGLYAFISTLTITAAAQWMYVRCGCGRKGIAGGFCFSFIVMLGMPLSIHKAVGTPDIWETILPGLVWGAGYLAVFLILTEKKKLKKRQ